MGKGVRVRVWIMTRHAGRNLKRGLLLPSLPFLLKKKTRGVYKINLKNNIQHGWYELIY